MVILGRATSKVVIALSDRGNAVSIKIPFASAVWNDLPSNHPQSLMG